jgi:para-aminobenzoate synthetase/4-amino-4-deoxychorismate lyase
MRIIAQLEDTPREIYTGSIGYCFPGRRAQFSVAIRTAWVDRRTHRATYGIGGGIVWDSDPDDEYNECLTKSRVLHATSADRDFQLLETMLWKSEGGFFLLKYHLDRMQSSARYFDFSFDRMAVDHTIDNWHPPTRLDRYRVRLLLDRDGTHRIVDALPIQDSGNQLQRIALASQAMDSGNPFLFHKTTNRRVYEDALRAAGSVDDVLLWNSAGFVTETTRANVVVRLHGRLATPPVSAGLLAGTYRQWMLENTELIEQNVHRNQLEEIDGITLINSVRGEYSGRLCTTEV